MEKDIRTTFQNTIFYGIWISRCFLRCYVAGEEKDGIFKSNKNRVLVSCTNIFFTLKILMFVITRWKEKKQKFYVIKSEIVLRLFWY